MEFGSITTILNNLARIEQPIVGTGTLAPAYSGGAYTGPSDATYTITITKAGPVGEATFSCNGIISDPDPLRDPANGIIVHANDIADTQTVATTSTDLVDIGGYGVQMRWAEGSLVTTDSWTIYVTTKVLLTGDIIVTPAIGMVLEKIKPMEEGSVSLVGVFDNIPMSITSEVSAWAPAYYDSISGVVTDATTFPYVGAFANSYKPSNSLCRILLNATSSPRPWPKDVKRKLLHSQY